MFKLIRDNIPEVMAEKGMQFNYASAQNDEFFKALLRGKLVEEVNEYLASRDNLEELVDIQTVIDYLIADRQEEFKQIYEQKLKLRGGFDKKYIGFFPDTPTEGNTQTEMEV
jgi:predicted house-cleaning noncanonical NTP pyrophosphatase (MazG superfamily)